METIQARTTAVAQGPPPWSLADLCNAHNEWGLNCGPGALAAIARVPLEDVRAALAIAGRLIVRGKKLPDFETCRYTNPSMMAAALAALGVSFRVIDGRRDPGWPFWGLMRIQWQGPWLRRGAPASAAYAHTHWIGVSRGTWKAPDGKEILAVFDVNNDTEDGWSGYIHWASKTVPQIIRECEPKATGWHASHRWECLPSRL